MTAEEYLDKVRINEIPYNIIMFRPIEVIQMLQDFTRLKCKEVTDYYNRELDDLYFSGIVCNEIHKRIKLNSPEPEI